MKNWYRQSTTVERAMFMPTYVVSSHRFFRQHGVEETIHRLLQLRAVVRNVRLKMQRIQRHAELLSETPEARQTDCSSVEVILAV